MDAGGPTPSTLSDFSQKAIQKAIRNEALTHPVTLFSGVATVLTALSWATFGMPAFLWAAFGAATISIGSLIVNYCFRDRILGETYVQKLNERFLRQKEDLLHSLHSDLEKCAEIPGAEDHVAQGLDQFVKIKQSYDNLRELLEQSVGAGGLDYGRFWGASEQAYLGVLDNLRQMVTVLKSLVTIDPDYITQRLRQLDDLDKLTDADKREQVTLEKRQQLREEQLRKVNDILTRNEEAITGIEEATAALAATGAHDDTFADVDPETSIGQLRELAEKVRTSRKERGV
jgi:hypothetical protein